MRALNLIEGYTKTVLGMDEQVRTCDRTYIRLVENDVLQTMKLLFAEQKAVF